MTFYEYAETGEFKGIKLLQGSDLRLDECYSRDKSFLIPKFATKQNIAKFIVKNKSNFVSISETDIEVSNGTFGKDQGLMRNLMIAKCEAKIKVSSLLEKWSFLEKALEILRNTINELKFFALVQNICSFSLG